MHAADVFVLSSVREGLPMTILEAMRAGLPVVATRAGGCAEVVRDGETGRLAPIGDPPALAAALAELLESPERAGALGEAGRRLWSDRYTGERMVRDTEALYHDLLETPPPAVARAS
jgi:glycosyltransferase involved in cell wall biosynthesis